MHPQKSPTLAHITRKRGVFYYRRRFPRPLVGEIGLSLRTRNYRRAEHLASCLDTELLRALRQRMTESELAGVLRGYLENLLIDYREAHWSSRVDRSVFGNWTPKDEDPTDFDLEFIQDQIGEYREAIGRRDASRVVRAVDELMAANDIPVEHRAAITEGVLAANIKALKVMRLRLLGRMDGVVFASSHAQPLAAPVSTVVGPRLSEIIPAFETEMTRGEPPAWDAHTAGQNKNTLARFLEICGDRNPAAYSLKDITRFLGTMEELPKTYGKSSKDKERMVAELIARANEASISRLARGTIERHKATIGRLFTFLVQAGHRENNPVNDHKFMRSEDPKVRRPWSSEQLHTFFSSPFFTGCASPNRRTVPGDMMFWDHFYWLPLLGLYHGNRLEEFAQLRREDILREDGVDFIRITDADGRKLKNKPSRRRVPIHPHILELGFLDYVEQVAPTPDSNLFPVLTASGKAKKLGHYFSRRFTEYRRQLGVYEELRDYHSFRHGVETKLGGMSDVHERFIDILLGHQGTGTGRKIYLDRGDIPVTDLAKIISRVDFPEVRVVRAKAPIVLRQKSESP